MADMKFSASVGDDPDQTADGLPIGAVAVGVLLVGIGGAMLAERLDLLPQAWRLQIWPVLLMAFGAARLLQPRRRGRRGLVFVLGGAWWFAVLSGWLSAERTWPLLIVGFGADVMLAAMTTQRGLPPADGFRRRHSGGLGWVLIAILVGALITNGGGRDWSEMVAPNAQFRSVVVAGRSDHHVESLSAGDADIVLAPDLESGNMLAKQLEYLGGADGAGIMLGARVPVALTSRADNELARTTSALLCVLVAQYQDSLKKPII